jgi:hypothetical protein
MTTHRNTIMMSKRFNTFAAAGLLLASGLFGHAEPAHAGNVYAAQLGCFVDTYAFDYTQIGSCGAAWTPGSASNPTVAYFEIVGLPAGNYTYVWTNLETGGNAGCSGPTCMVSIATETRGDGYAALAVTITDLSNGAQNTVSADAEYVDGWN